MYLALFLLNLLCSEKLAEFGKHFSFIVISATWSFNFQMVLLFYINLICLSVKYSSTKRGAC